MLTDAQRERWEFDVALARDTRDRGREHSGQLVAPSLLVAVADEMRELRAALAEHREALQCVLDVGKVDRGTMRPEEFKAKWLGNLAGEFVSSAAKWLALSVVDELLAAGQPAGEERTCS